MKPSPLVRTDRISDSLHHHLNLYAIAAGAAGVGMLTLAQPAEAKIIYTKADQRIWPFGMPLDLNHDGTPDFVFMTYMMATTPATVWRVSINPELPSNAVWINRKAFAAALRPGVEIGSGKNFRSHQSNVPMGSVVKAQSDGKLFYYGPWENGGKGVKSRYLGLRFQVEGKTHYGWARLNFPSPQGAKLTGYAYETIPNKAIIAGKTKGQDMITAESSSLGHLAMGRR